MTNRDYDEAREYLFSLQLHKIKLGLDSMRDFLARVGSPEKDLKFIHVAGTNGKGSVSVTILTLLAEAGYRVGLYTSPHLSSVRERFRINDRYMSRDQFTRLTNRIRETLGEDMITYFEFTTALALLWFAEEQPDLVILETGLGGRLDATNVVTPLMTVITNVSMDHEAWLGNTLTEVAGEKAGIIKEKVPLVSGVAEEETFQVVETVSHQKHAPLYLLGRDFKVEPGPDRTWGFVGRHPDLAGFSRDGLRCAMKGSYQQGNAALALAVLALVGKNGFTVSGESVKSGLAKVYWPGRLEYLCLDRTSRSLLSRSEKTGDNSVSYLLDGAHNPAGVDSLVATLQSEYCYERLIVVWGAMADKDLDHTVAAISKMADQIILTRPEGDRSADPQTLQKSLPPAAADKSELVEPVQAALVRAEELAGPDDLILVAGSLYLVGAAHHHLLGSLVDQ